MEDNLLFRDSPYGQRFKISETPWLKEPLACIPDNEVQEVWIKSAAQLGKTVILQGGIAWTLAEAPGPTMVVIDTLDSAKELAEEKINPTLESCPQLRDQMPDDKVGKKKLKISFPQASMLIGPANNSFLRQKSIRYLWCDECSKYGEGNIQNAKARTKRYANRRQFFVSTPTTDDHDFAQGWQGGTCEEWSLQCQGCEQLIVPTFKDVMVWDDDEKTKPKGKWDYKEVRKTVRLKCPHCGHEHTHTPEVIRRMNDGGGYTVTNPEASGRVRSFRFNTLCLGPSIVSWEDLVEEFLKAKSLARKGFTQPLQEFLNLQLAEDWKAHEHLDEDLITFDDYSPADKWEHEARRYMTVDCQKDLIDFWVVVRAWAKNGDSRLLGFRRPRSWDEVAEIAAEFEIPPNRVFVDVQYKRNDVITELARRGWHGFQGEDNDSFLHIESWPGGVKKKRWKIFSKPTAQKGMNLPRAPHVWMWSNPAVKDILHRLKIGKGSKWEVCDLGTLTEAYQKQINSEHKVERRRGGKSVMVWENFRENHAWDCECMQVVVATIQKLYGTE
jgi:hypothetical protein